MRRGLLDLLVCPLTGQGLLLDALDVVDGDVRHGLLRSEGAWYPIIGGIPVLRGDTDRLVGHVVGGRYREAAVDAAFGDLALSRRARWRASARPAAVLTPRGRQRSADRLAVHALFEDAAPLGALRHAYLDSTRRSVDALSYFTYRFGIPRHLVVLSLLEVVADGAGPVLDLGCGAGHMTWSLTGHRRGPVVGVDPSFLHLWDARKLAPEAELVCADGASLPFRTEGFDAVLAADVLSFVPDKWAVCREAERVLRRGGTMALTSVKNADCDHVYAGEPLSAPGWRRLVAHLPHRLVADDDAVDAYLHRRGAPLAAATTDGELARARTLTVVAVKADEHRFRDGAPLHDWPHARHGLAVNPLYRRTAGSRGTDRYELRLPSASFGRDNPLLRTYLPERFTLPADAVDATRDGKDHPELEPLVASVALLSLPVGYGRPVWPAPATRLPPAVAAVGGLR